MKLGINMLAGVANSAWTAVVNLIVVPFYIKYLGIDAYGLIGFFATLQVMLQLLDLGLTPTINREVARCSATGELEKARNLLHTLAYVYWGMAVVIALLIYTAAPLIAEYWLRDKGLPQHTILTSIVLMGLIVACRWPIGVYAGALMGAQRITVSSGVNMIMITIANFGAVVVIAFFSPTVEAFFAWQACAGMAYALVIRKAAWRVLKRIGTVRFDLDSLKRIWRFSAGMGGVAVSAVILLQIDKVMLSKILSLQSFGHYTLSTVLAGSLYILLSPLFNAIYPYMTSLVTNGEEDKLVRFYRVGTRLFLSLLFPVAVTISIFSRELLFLWTRDQAVANSAAPIVSIFIFGTALNGAMHFPYALQLAYGCSRLPFQINLVLICVVVPTIYYLANVYGAVGGAMAWLAMNATYLLMGSWLTHRLLLKGIGIRWLFADVGLPMLLAGLIAGAGGLIVQRSDLPDLADLALGAILVLVTVGLAVSLSPKLRTTVRDIQIGLNIRITG